MTSGYGRETWERKSIALVDLTGSSPSVKVITQPSMSAQLPSWSPDGARFAWCAGPDAAELNKQQLLSHGQRTVRAIDPSGQPREIPITSSLRLGAPPDLERECVRSRRIWIAGMSAPHRATQLTSDPNYFDEEPRWARVGDSMLFCRTDAHGTRSIWLMHPDGSQQRKIAGPLRPPPDLSEVEKFSYAPYYGYTNWRSFFDWRQS